MCLVTQYPNKNVALVASDILHLLISHVDHLQKFPPDTPKKIVEVRDNLSVCLNSDWNISITPALFIIHCFMLCEANVLFKSF